MERPASWSYLKLKKGAPKGVEESAAKTRLSNHREGDDKGQKGRTPNKKPNWNLELRSEIGEGLFLILVPRGFRNDTV